MKLSTLTYPDTNQTAIPNTTIKNPDRTLVVMFGPSHLLDAAAPIQWSWLRTQEPLPLGAPAPEKFSRRISRTTRWSLPSSNSSTQQSAQPPHRLQTPDSRSKPHNPLFTVPFDPKTE
jgi:hypothetical protein